MSFLVLPGGLTLGTFATGTAALLIGLGAVLFRRSITILRTRSSTGVATATAACSRASASINAGGADIPTRARTCLRKYRHRRRGEKCRYREHRETSLHESPPLEKESRWTAPTVDAST